MFLPKFVLLEGADPLSGARARVLLVARSLP
jgi:hypothetical protein